MVRNVVFFGLFCFVFGCQQIEPQERAATVAVLDFSKCGGCGGWIVEVDNQSFRAELPAEFTKPNTPVWIRYKKDESNGLKKASGWIKILSIRRR